MFDWSSRFLPFLIRFFLPFLTRLPDIQVYMYCFMTRPTSRSQSQRGQWMVFCKVSDFCFLFLFVLFLCVGRQQHPSFLWLILWRICVKHCFSSIGTEVIVFVRSFTDEKALVQFWRPPWSRSVFRPDVFDTTNKCLSVRHQQDHRSFCARSLCCSSWRSSVCGMEVVEVHSQVSKVSSPSIQHGTVAVWPAHNSFSGQRGITPAYIMFQLKKKQIALLDCRQVPGVFRFWVWWTTWIKLKCDRFYKTGKRSLQMSILLHLWGKLCAWWVWQSCPSRHQLLIFVRATPLFSLPTFGVMSFIQNRPKAGKISWRVFQVNSYELIKEVLLTRSDNFAGRPKSFRCLDQIQFQHCHYFAFPVL